MEDVERYGSTLNSIYFLNQFFHCTLSYSLFLGIHDVIYMALNKIDPDNSKSLHVSFDIDSLDPLEAPSTGTAGP